MQGGRSQHCPHPNQFCQLHTLVEAYWFGALPGQWILCDLRILWQFSMIVEELGRFSWFQLVGWRIVLGWGFSWRNCSSCCRDGDSLCSRWCRIFICWHTIFICWHTIAADRNLHSMLLVIVDNFYARGQWVAAEEDFHNFLLELVICPDKRGLNERTARIGDCHVADAFGCGTDGVTLPWWCPLRHQSPHIDVICCPSQSGWGCQTLSLPRSHAHLIFFAFPQQNHRQKWLTWFLCQMGEGQGWGWQWGWSFCPFFTIGLFDYVDYEGDLRTEFFGDVVKVLHGKAGSDLIAVNFYGG